MGDDNIFRGSEGSGEDAIERFSGCFTRRVEGVRIMVRVNESSLKGLHVTYLLSSEPASLGTERWVARVNQGHHEKAVTVENVEKAIPRLLRNEPQGNSFQR